MPTRKILAREARSLLANDRRKAEPMIDLIAAAEAAYEEQRSEDASRARGRRIIEMTDQLARAGFMERGEVLTGHAIDPEWKVFEWCGLHFSPSVSSSFGPTLVAQCPHCDDNSWQRIGTAKDLAELGRLLATRPEPFCYTCAAAQNSPSRSERLEEIIIEIASNVARDVVAEERNR